MIAFGTEIRSRIEQSKIVFVKMKNAGKKLNIGLCISSVSFLGPTLWTIYALEKLKKCGF